MHMAAQLRDGFVDNMAIEAEQVMSATDVKVLPPF
jgi:hypothetical protein